MSLATHASQGETRMYLPNVLYAHCRMELMALVAAMPLLAIRMRWMVRFPFSDSTNFLMVSRLSVLRATPETSASRTVDSPSLMLLGKGSQLEIFFRFLVKLLSVAMFLDAVVARPNV